MSLDSYLVDGETVVAEAPTESDTSTSDGVLACTKDRVIHVDGNDVTDLSLRSVNAIEYSAPSFPWTYGLAGVGSFFFAGFGYAARSSINDALPGFLDGFAMLGVVLLAFYGALALVLGYYYQGRHELTVHLPSTSFEFASRSSEIEQVAHAIRAHEP